MAGFTWFIIFLAVTEAAWMTFDGLRALLVGDYVTPRTGQYAGQLGPWHHVVAAVGIEPRSTAMKSVFVVYGVSWLAVTVGFALQVSWAWWGMLFFAVGSLWYFFIGTATSVTIIVLLVISAVRYGLP